MIYFINVQTIAFIKTSGGRLNIKMPSYQYRDPYVKDKTVSPTVLSLTWESPYLGKTIFILRRGPDRGFLDIDMRSSFWRTYGTWMFWFLVLPYQVLVEAESDKYHEVPKEAFMDVVTFKCQRQVPYSDTVVGCVPFCFMSNRRRCFAFAWGRTSCWVCGKDIAGRLTARNITHVHQFWVHSGTYTTQIGSSDMLLADQE